MTRSQPPSQPPPPGFPDDDGLLLDSLRGELDAAQAASLEARLVSEPYLAARRRALARESAAFMAAVTEPTEPGLAQRLALRVRDGVAHEEHVARRAHVVGRPAGWTRRTWVRIVLGSLAAHVLLLGWVVWNDRDAPIRERENQVATGWRGPESRLPSSRDLDAPFDLDGPVVASESISNEVLVLHGLPLAEEGSVSFPEPNVRVAEHPYEVQFDMITRTRAPVKDKRLARMGLNAQGIRSGIDRGLAALAARQSPDGSFPLDVTVAVGSRPALEPLGMTGLALLPFLAEGRCSTGMKGGAGDPVVANGIQWLREWLLGPHRGVRVPAPTDLSLAVLALSEDYMLSYGRWTPAEGQMRGQELRMLGERLAGLQRDDGSFDGRAGDPSAPLWPLLALDAVQHTGVASPSARTTERLQRWYAALPRAPEGVPAGPDGRPDAVLTAGAVLLGSTMPPAAGEPDPVVAAAARLLVGADVSNNGRGALTALAASTALYRRNPAAFRSWSQANGEALLARLSPSGLVLRGDAVVLLALQSSYRVY
jgi:hypothetical protein